MERNLRKMERCIITGIPTVERQLRSWYQLRNARLDQLLERGVIDVPPLWV